MASMFPPKKGVAFTLYFTLYKNDGTVVANPGTITKKVSIDGGDVADITAAVTEENTTYGQCSLVFSTSEMNGDAVWFYITDDTAGTVPFTGTLYTTANTQDELGTAITAIDDYIDTELGALTTELAKVPKSDSNVTWNATALASINAEVDTALNTAIPGTPTADSINERIATMDGHITADYGSTEKAAIDLLDDAAGGLADLHTDVGTVITNQTTINNNVLTRSTLTAQQVWEYGTRTLSSFGTLVADIWANVARTITGGTITTYTGNTPQTGDSFARLGAPAGASVSADIAAVKAETALIVADTNELQTDWVNGGRLDLLLDGTKAKTDQLTFTTPNSVDATASVALTAEDIQSIVDGVNAEIGENVWAATPRTLTSTAAETIATVSGSDINIQRGDSLSFSLTGLGNISTRTKLWFTVKSGDGPDVDAIIDIEETSGLVRLNGAAGTAIQGDITVDDATAGDITITMDEVATAQLPITSGLDYDVQMLTATSVQTLTSGLVTISKDVKRATS